MPTPRSSSCRPLPPLRADLSQTKVACYNTWTPIMTRLLRPPHETVIEPLICVAGGRAPCVAGGGLLRGRWRRVPKRGRTGLSSFDQRGISSFDQRGRTGLSSFHCVAGGRHTSNGVVHSLSLRGRWAAQKQRGRSLPFTAWQVGGAPRSFQYSGMVQVFFFSPLSVAHAPGSSPPVSFTRTIAPVSFTRAITPRI